MDAAEPAYPKNYMAEVNTSVPVVTPNGGNPAAYQDPNSPESMLRRTKEAEVQARADTRYDMGVYPYETFRGSIRSPFSRTRSSSISNFQLNSPLTPALVFAIGWWLRTVLATGKRR